MTKIELVELMAAKARIKKAAAERAINTFVQAIKDTLSNGGTFTISGFGTFSVARRKPRLGRNPKTGERIQIPAIQSIRFKASAKVKKRL